MADDAGRSREDVPRPSWIDRLANWIDDLPGHSMFFYILLTAVGILLNNAVFWIDGGLEFGSFDAGLSMFAVYSLLWIALYHLLNRPASQALKTFRPLLEASEAEIETVDAVLTTLPRNLGWSAVLLGIVIAVSEIPADLANSLGPIANQARTALPAAYFTVVAAFFSAAFSALIIRTVRQLRLITSLHERATAVDLQSLHAPHAFSAFTARIGAALILILVLFSIPVPLDAASELSWSGFDIASYVAIALMAIAAFILPLVGMRNRLRQEKDRALAEVDELYRAACDRLNGQIRNGDYEETGRTKDAISALLIQRDRLSKISTWPWDPGTARGLSSTVLLPIFLLLVSRLLARLF